jgi:hypothetical protein
MSAVILFGLDGVKKKHNERRTWAMLIVTAVGAG